MKQTLIYLFAIVLLVPTAKAQFQRVDSLEMELSRFGDASRYNKYAVSLMNELSLEYMEANLSEALRYSEDAITTSTRIGDPEGTCRGLLNRGLIQIHANNPIQGVNDIERAISNAKTKRLHGIVVDALEHLAEFYSRVGNLTESAELLSAAMTVRETYHINAGRAGSYSKLASMKKELGQYDEALKLYEKAHRSIHATKGNSSSRSEADIVTRLSELSAHRGDWPAAARYGREALKHATEIGDNSAILKLHSDLGLYYWRTKAMNNAQKHCSSAGELGKTIGTDHAILLSELSLGRLNEIGERWSDALEHYSVAFKQANDEEESGIRMGAAVGIARILVISGKAAKAKTILESVQPSLRAGQHRLYAEDIALIQTLVAYETNSYLDALTAFTGYTSQMDSLNRTERVRKLNELEVNYQLQLRERENIVLLKDKELKEIELLRQADELALLTRDKEMQALQLSEREATVKLHKRIAKETKKELALLEQEKRVQDLELERERMLANIWGAGGTILGLVLILVGFLYRQKKRAESEQRQKAKQLAEANEQILLHQQEVEKKSTELKLALDQLQYRNESLEILNKEKSEFLSIAAHDLKNPIGLIHGLADLIMASELDEELVFDSMDNILHATDRMIVLISNLLDIDRIESGDVQICRHELDVQQILNEAVRMNTPKARAKDISLRNSSMLTNVNGLGDSASLQQVLDNLISNAIKFSVGGSSVTAWVTEDTDWVEIHVKDEGPGINKEDQKLLFKKFARLTPQPTGGEVSTGLGLYIVNRLVKAMGASISCESTLGTGTEFIVRMPRVKSEVVEPLVLSFN